VNGFLLDTNVISEPLRPRPDERVTKWFESTDEDMLYLSVLTLGEVRKGVELMVDPVGRKRIEQWLTSGLIERFSGRILPVDLSTADRWGKIAGSEAARRSPLPAVDALLAATALENELTLVSRDTWHFEQLGLPVFNPWTD
jgi:toxin FitB